MNTLYNWSNGWTVAIILRGTVSGAIRKRSSSSETSSEIVELEDAEVMADPQTELRRLQEEERLLIETMPNPFESEKIDDFAALEHQDNLRRNQVRDFSMILWKKNSQTSYYNVFHVIWLKVVVSAVATFNLLEITLC